MNTYNKSKYGSYFDILNDQGSNIDSEEFYSTQMSSNSGGGQSPRQTWLPIVYNDSNDESPSNIQDHNLQQ